MQRQRDEPAVLATNLNVRRNLNERRSRNLYAAKVAMRGIVGRLERMRTLVTPETQAAFDPTIEKYRGWLKALERNTWGGSMMSDFERSEREVRSRFSPSQVSIVSGRPAPKPAPKTGNVPADLAGLPAESPSSATPPAGKAETKEPPGARPTISFRLLYKAWDRAHDDLVSAYREMKDCGQEYKDVVEALRLMKAQLEGDRAANAGMYLDYYAGVHEKTKGFTELPEKTTEADVIYDLSVAAHVVRRAFNPDK